MTGGHDEDRERADWLTAVLDEEARRYEPDGERIRRRIGGRSRVRRSQVRGSRRARWAGIPAGIAAAALSAGIAVAVAATVSGRPHAQSITSANRSTAVATSTPSTPSTPSTSPVTSPRVSVTSAPAATSAVSPVIPSRSAVAVAGSGEASASASAQASKTPASGTWPVTAVGGIGPNSNASWTEEDVDVTLAESVNAFELTVNVAPGPGLFSTGDWSNRDITAFDVHVNSGPDGLVYTFTLKPGRSLAAGTFTMAVQFQHGTGRGVSGDTYSLNAANAQAHGGF